MCKPGCVLAHRCSLTQLHLVFNLRFLLITDTTAIDTLDTSDGIDNIFTNFEQVEAILLSSGYSDRVVWVAENNASWGVDLFVPEYVSLDLNSPYRIVVQSSLYNDFPTKSHTFAFAGGLANIALMPICTGLGSPTNCNNYYPICTPPQVANRDTWACDTPDSILRCPKLDCPSPLEPNQDCSDCTCTTRTCDTFTRRFMLYFNPTPALATSIESTYKYGFYKQFLEPQLVSLLQISTNSYSPSDVLIARPISSNIGVYSPINDGTTVRGILCTISILSLPPGIGETGNEITTAQAVVNRFAEIQTILTTYFSPSPSQTTLDKFNAFFATSKTTPTSFPIAVTTSQHQAQFFHPTERSLTTRCQFTTISGIVKSNHCPLPSLSKKSPMWSKCPTTPTTNDVQSLQLLCRDYNNIATPIPSIGASANNVWCAVGRFPDVPTQATVPCVVDTTIKPTISAATVSSPSTGPATAGSLVKLQWTYTGPQNYTVGITLYGSQYATQFATATSPPYLYFGSFPASAGTATIQLPFTLADTSNNFFKLVVAQFAEANTPTPSTLTINKYTCPCGSGLCDQNGKCICPYTLDFFPGTTNFETASCQCPQAYYQSGHFVSTQTPSVCECTADYTGPTCMIWKTCLTSPIGSCQNGGYPQTSYPNTGSGGYGFYNPYCDDSKPCICKGNWIGNKCTQCNLGCISENTVSDNACTTCTCKVGFGGDKCEYRSVLVTLRYTTTTSSTSLSLFGTVETTTKSFIVLELDNQQYQLSNNNHHNNSNKQSNQSQSLSSKLLNLFSTLADPQNPTDVLSQATQDQLRLQLAISLGIRPEEVTFKYLIKTTPTTPTAQLLQSLETPTATATTTTITTMSNQQQPSSPFSLLQNGSTTTTTTLTFSLSSNTPAATTTTTATTNPQGSTSITDLYGSWSLLQDNLKNTPVGSEKVDEFGSAAPSSADDPFDPQCTTEDEDDGVSCPTGTDPTLPPIVPPPDGDGNGGDDLSTVTLIAIIVGVICGSIIIFGALALPIRYCYKNKVGLFAENENNTKRQRVNSTTSGTEMSVATNIGSSTRDDPKSASAASSSSQTRRSTTADLELIDDGEELPPSWEKFKHKVTGETLYINSATMVSQKHKPGTEAAAKGRWF